MNAPLSRRGLLATFAGIGAAALVAACSSSPASAPTAAPSGGPTAPTAAPAPTTAAPTQAAAGAAPAAPQPAAPGKVTVELIAASWVIQEWKLPDWVKKYNDLGGPQINLTQTTDGWDTKVLAMIRQGDVLWDGNGIMTPFIDKVKWVETGMIQPVDSLIQSSTAPDAKALVGDWVPTIKDDITYKGKVYGIPYSVEAIGLMWLTEFLGGIGAKQAPGTWTDTLDAATQINGKYKDQQVTPLAWVGALHTSLQALIHSASKTPYTSDGLLDLTGDAGMKAGDWLVNLVKAGLTPPHGGDGAIDIWQKRKLALLMAQNSRGVWAQRIFGMAAAGTGKMPLSEAGGQTSGSPFWSNTFVVFNKAKHPQELADFYVWLLGPGNKEVWQAIIASGKAPVLNSTYKTMIETNNDYKWMADFRDQIAASVAYPENTFWSIQNDKIMPWINKMVTPPFSLSPKEAMQGALKDVKDEVAKQKVQ